MSVLPTLRPVLPQDAPDAETKYCAPWTPMNENPATLCGNDTRRAGTLLSEMIEIFWENENRTTLYINNSKFTERYVVSIGLHQ